MAAPRPLPATPPGLLDDEDPGKWEKLKQVLWESNLNAPVRGVYNLMNTPYDVLMGGQSPEFDQAVADSFDAAGGITVGSMPMPKPANSLSMGIKAYHGSPHSFDKFSMDKIGTGEGAQAYGHGLYFAENEGVAKGYRDTLSGSMVSGAQKRLEKAGGDIDKAIADVQSRIDNYRANGAPQYADAIEEDLRGLIKFKETGQWTPGSMYEVEINADLNAFLDWDKPLSEQPGMVEKLQSAIGLPSETIDHWRRGLLDDLKNEGPEGYKPDRLNRAIDEAISYGGYGPEFGTNVWDEISEAAPTIGGEFRDILNRHGSSIDPEDTGKSAWSLASGAKYSEEEARKALHKAGIPGIKYLDAGSRGKGVAHVQPMYKGKPYGDPIPATAWNQVDQLTQRYKDMGYDVEVQDLGTRNYVVFDDSLINIIRKYGIAGLLGGAGLYGMTNDEAQAGAY